MDIIESPQLMHRWIEENPPSMRRGFVPTMGALHLGHEALLQHSRNDNDQTVLSIFVNPTQFNVQEDFDKYPRTIDRDLAVAEHHGVDAVYMPTADSMYTEQFRSFVEPGVASEPMEGANRPGHFRGVTTVVTKLFNATRPHRVYFGKKDYQQLAVIRQLVDELDFPITVIGVDTVRDNDGLALSSRNQRLTPDARKDAPVIYRALTEVKKIFLQGERSSAKLLAHFNEVISHSDLITLEYATLSDAHTLQEVAEIRDTAVLCVAGWYEDVRLIDNIELSLR